MEYHSEITQELLSYIFQLIVDLEDKQPTPTNHPRNEDQLYINADVTRTRTPNLRNHRTWQNGLQIIAGKDSAATSEDAT